MYENSRTGVRIRPERVYENLQNQQLILAKQRDSPRGVKIPLTRDGKCAKFITSDRGLGEGSVSPSTMHSKNGF